MGMGPGPAAMRAGIRNKTRRSLTQKDEKTGALGPMGSLGA